MTRPVRILFAFALLTVLSTGPSLSTMAADRPAPESTPAPKPMAVIRGEIAHPGRYELREGETLSSLILRAGGYTDNAWLPGAVLLRKSEKERQAEEIEEMAPQLADRDTLRLLSPSGRIPIRLSLPRLMMNSPEDLILEAGDDLFLPGPPRTIRVEGAVMNPGDFDATGDLGVPETIDRAGGFRADADRDGTILLKADGIARMMFEPWIVWNDAAGRWELSVFRKDRPRIEAGDTLFVPRRPGRMPWPGGIDEYRRTMLRLLEITGPGTLP